MRAKKEKYPLVYLEWEDAVSNSEGWRDERDVKLWAKETNWLVKESGFLIEETAKYILLANKMIPQSQDNEVFFGMLKKIPKGWIRKRTVLSK